MSANRDTSQKISFVYSNMYRIYKQGKADAAVAVIKEPPVKPINGLKLSLLTLQQQHAELKKILAELEELVKK